MYWMVTVSPWLIKRLVPMPEEKSKLAQFALTPAESKMPARLKVQEGGRPEEGKIYRLQDDPKTFERTGHWRFRLYPDDGRGAREYKGVLRFFTLPFGDESHIVPPPLQMWVLQGEREQGVLWIAAHDVEYVISREQKERRQR